MPQLKRVTALVPFYDKVEKVHRKAGEEFSVSAKRLAELNACGREQGFAPLVEELRAKEPAKKSEDSEK